MPNLVPINNEKILASILELTDYADRINYSPH